MIKNIYKLSLISAALGLMSPSISFAQSPIMDNPISNSTASPVSPLKPDSKCRPQKDGPGLSSSPQSSRPCQPSKNYNETQKKMIQDYRQKSQPKIEALKKEHKDLLIQKEAAKTPAQKAKLEMQAKELREKRIAFKKEFKEFKEKLDKAKTPIK